MPNYNLSTFNNNYQQISICDIPNKQQQNLKNIKTIHTETQLQNKRAVPTIKKNLTQKILQDLASPKYQKKMDKQSPQSPKKGIPVVAITRVWQLSSSSSTTTTTTITTKMR